MRTPDTAPGTTARPAVARYVEQVMGMPVSLALRGRHTDDDAARQAWTVSSSTAIPAAP